MYLSEIKLWNFRQYGIKGDKLETAEPGMVVQFNKGVNVLVGENDSGKTAIVDAIRYSLRTQSGEYIEFEDRDFHHASGYSRSVEFKIECTFSGFSNAEAGKFLEWIGFDDNNDFILKIWLYARRTSDNRIIPKFHAGFGSEGSYIDGEARDLLRVIYLKPLRDALSEMTSGRRSRLAQILKSLEAFSRKKEGGSLTKHEMESEYDSYKKKIDTFFESGRGKPIQDDINEFLIQRFLFKNESRQAGISIVESELNEILRALNLILEPNKSGLGSLNLLFIAAELLQLKEQKRGLKLTLVEELEAHLHPQYQLRVIDFIEQEKEDYGQFILTTHSTTLASKIDLENLIICHKGKAFPMGHNYTQLSPGDYKFLQKFLDATKANMFFAKGVIIVEGPSEQLLLPTIAEIINRPLHHYGVSIVNVGNTAFRRYSNVFLRKEPDEGTLPPEEYLPIPVSVVADLDVRSLEYFDDLPDDSPIRTEIISIEGKDIDSFQEYAEELEIASLVGRVYSSKNNFWERCKAYKKVKRFKSGTRKGIEVVLDRLTTTLDHKTIAKIRAQTLADFQFGYPNQKVKLFPTLNWTLEYEIAKSGMQEALCQAVQLALRAKADDGFQMGTEDIADALITAVAFIDSVDDESADQTAYRVFAPINDKTVSKPVVAQILRELLLKGGDALKEKVRQDPNLQYLRDAIFHVTELETISEDTENSNPEKEEEE